MQRRKASQPNRAPQGVADRPSQAVDAKAPAAPTSAAGVLALQRSIGNEAVTRMLRNGGSQRPSVARLITQNPGDLTDASGQSTTTWMAPTLADALLPDFTVRTPPGVPATTPLPTPVAVKPKATQASPLVQPTATAAELYDQEAAPAAGAAPTAGFQVVSSMQGAPASPAVDQVADPSLWIDPGPTALDVRQSGIGDCYALAAIIGIVNRDPGKIVAMMRPDGAGGAGVTLYHRLAHPPGFFGFLSGPTYQPEQVQVSADLAFNRLAPGASQRAQRIAGSPQFGHQLHGAQLYASATPKESRWWATVNGSTVEVHRQDVFQMARWAPLLEKAIERFSQVYGQYGHGGQIAGEGEKKGASGQVNIAGGWSGHTLSMFYGQAGEVVAGGKGDEIGTQWGPGQNAQALLDANAAAFDRLLTLAGRGPGHAPGARTAPIVTATTGTGEPGQRLYANRLQAAIPAAMAAPDYAGLSAGAKAKISAAMGWTSAWLTAAPDPPATTPPTPPPPPPNTKSWAFAQWQPACATAAADAEITAPTRSAPIQAMLDLLLVIQNMPRDTGGGTRSVYANHVYAVLAADIRAVGGGASDIHTRPAAERRTFYNTVDTQASTVTMMNPHHTNAPATIGGGPPTPEAITGQFSLSLERFFRLYGTVMSNELTIPAY